MISIIKNHWFVGVLAFVVGIIIVLPTLLSIKNAGESFRGIYPMLNNDEEYYLSLSRDVYDGHYNLGNAFIKEYKDKPSLQQSLSEIIIASEAKLLNFSIPKTATLNDFVLPFLGVLFIYALIFGITKSKKVSGFISFLFYFIFLGSFNRPTNPQFSFVVFLLGVLFVWKIISEEHSLKKLIVLNIALGIIFGALVYIYPFYWSSVIVLYVVSSFFLVFKQKNYGYWVKNWLVFGATSLLVAIPYAFNLLASIKDPFFAEASLRQSIISNHWPAAFFNVVLMFGCLVLVYLVQKDIKNKKSLVFAYSLVLSGIILNWQNVITGKYLLFSSHYYIATVLFSFLIFSICTKSFIDLFAEKSKIDFRRLVSIMFAIMLFIMTVYWQRNDIRGAYLNIVSPYNISCSQHLMPVADWLNKNTLKDSVVYTLGDSYEWLIPIYTHNNIYWQTYAGFYLISDEELENRWIIQNFFRDITEDDVINDQGVIWSEKFVPAYQNKEVRRKILQFITGKEYPKTVLMDQKYIDRVLEKYEQFKQMGFEKSVKTYAVDYVLLDLNDKKYVSLAEQFGKYGFLERVTEIGNVVIFRVR